MGMISSPTGKRRQAMSDINVTPLVDVMLVLLIIFMVTAPMMQQSIDVDLPETTASGSAPADEPFILTIARSGQISIGTASVDMEKLRTKVQAVFSNRKSKEIYIQADKKTAYGVVAEAMAEIRSAGILNINLVTLPKANE